MKFLIIHQFNLVKVEFIKLSDARSNFSTTHLTTKLVQ
jgi:hypothetical protein